ncbi:MAG TPA: hypothetical protein ENI06_04120 [Spirochaetales bacterium]|nr:hypothetical protein [Spirochaetales bacterium]
MKRKVVCYCDRDFEVDLPDQVELNPEMEEAILKGSFMSTKCPHCGKLLKPEFPVRVKNPERGIDIFMVPEQDRNVFYDNSLPYSIKEGMSVVIGHRELIEQLLVIKSALDMRAVEIVKFYLLKKALNDYDSEERLSIIFTGKEQDMLVFHIFGLKRDQLGIVHVALEKYQRIVQELYARVKEEPFGVLLAPPYVSINKFFSGDFLRGDS